MHAIEVQDGTCHLVRRPSPEMRPGCVRIEVEAAGVNRADLVQKAGRYPPPPGASDLLGLECAGVVTEVGPGVTRFKVGDRVCALLAGGGYAEEVVVEAVCVLPIPDGLTPVHAAAIVEVWATAWLNLGRLGGLATRTRPAHVLLHAGASGVGTAAIQLCAVTGHAPFVIVGSQAKIDRCRALGAAAGANRHDGADAWVEAVKAWSPDGVDVVLDPVGGTTLPHDLEVLAPDGRIVLIGLMGGREASVDLGKVLMKRARIEGSTLRARSVDFKADLLEELRLFAWPRFAEGAFQPIVDRTFPLADAEAAHAHVASNDTIGAVVLVP